MYASLCDQEARISNECFGACGAQERDVAERRAAHQEASCSNMKEEVQHARLETLAERKTSAKLRSEVRLKVCMTDGKHLS
jgi:hypothetical protein